VKAKQGQEITRYVKVPDQGEKGARDNEVIEVPEFQTLKHLNKERQQER